MRWWRITKRNADLERELQSDLALEEEEQRERGLSSEEARYAALRAFGNPTLIHEQTHATWSWSWLESLASDLKYGFRGMRRNAGSTVFAILIVGLGIGGASTVFSVVNALLLRPLPFRDPGQLVWISNAENYSTQAEHYSDLRDQNQSFSDLAGWSGAYSAGDKELTGTGEPERLTSVPVTENFFTLLGVEPAIGRSFTREECQGKYSAPPAMLLSDSFWRRRFAADPNVVGQKLTLNNQPVMVVGVLPASFDFASVFAPGTPIDVFIPWPLTDNTKPAGNTMAIVGRLKPGVTVQSAQAEFTVLAKQLESQHPERNPIRPEAGSAGTARERASASGSGGADVRCGCGHVDCLRQSFASANGAHGDATKGNGDTSGVRSRAFSAAATSAHREHNPLVLWRRAGPSSGRGWHARAGASPCVQPSSSGKRSGRWKYACLHLVGGGRFGRALWLGARAAGPGVQASRRAARRGPRVEWQQPAWLVPRRTGGLPVRPRLRAAGGRGAADSKFSARAGCESWVSTGARRCVEDRPEFSDLESRASRTHLSTMCCIAPGQSPASRQPGSAMSCRSTGTGVGKSRPRDRFTTRTITRRPLFAW